MAITTFPALAPHLRSVTYYDNFKTNIQNYWSSDPNIWYRPTTSPSRWRVATPTT
jgi:hypothetical protein